jgi:hypothetical protein
MAAAAAPQALEIEILVADEELGVSERAEGERAEPSRS